MIMGVLVIAFPVGVFTDLWSIELKRLGTLRDALVYDDEKNEMNGNNENQLQHHDNDDNKNSSPLYDTTNENADATRIDTGKIYPGENNAVQPSMDALSDGPTTYAPLDNRNKLLTSLHHLRSSTMFDLNHDNHHHDLDHDESNRILQEIYSESYVAIHKDDVLDMMYHLQLISQSQEQIRQSQQHIRSLFKKYKHHIHHRNESV
jgi:hypothetical protein